MINDINIHPETLYVLDYLCSFFYWQLKTTNIRNSINILSWYDFQIFLCNNKSNKVLYKEQNIIIIRDKLRLLNLLIKEIGDDQIIKLKNEFISEAINNLSWLMYDINIEVIPIYNEGVILVKEEMIIPQNKISNLINFINILKVKNDGIDIENHSWGFHFHYGKIVNNSLKRYDKILTFNPNDEYPPSKNSIVPLYVENHGMGKYKSIDISTIGNNKRRPIYEVCEKEMAKKGIDKFLKPSKNSSIFYPN